MKALFTCAAAVLFSAPAVMADHNLDLNRGYGVRDYSYAAGSACQDCAGRCRGRDCSRGCSCNPSGYAPSGYESAYGYELDGPGILPGGCVNGQCNIARNTRYGQLDFGADGDFDRQYGPDYGNRGGCADGQCTIPSGSNYGGVEGCVDGECTIPQSGGFSRRHLPAWNDGPGGPYSEGMSGFGTRPRVPSPYYGDRIESQRTDYGQPNFRGTRVSAPVAATGIRWQRDVRGAVQAAGRSGKPMLVTITADWCGSCRKMKAETFTDRSVIEHINGCFIPVAVDADTSRELVQRLGINALPANLVVAPDMRIVQRIQGFQSPLQMGRILVASCSVHPGRPLGANRSPLTPRAMLFDARVACLND